MNKLIQQFSESPRQLFLVDGLGALLSAFLLGVVLVRFEEVFGIPVPTLYVLAVIPVFFALYDGFVYRQQSSLLIKPLRSIAIMNLLYCCLSIACAVYHVEEVTVWGWGYIVVEVLIVVLLATIEMRVAKVLATRY